MKILAASVLAGGILAAIPAQALCIYDGKHFEKSDDYAEREKGSGKSNDPDFDARLYAKTVLKDEVTDARLIIRGTVLSRTDTEAPASPNYIDSIVTYRVRVEEVFKGKAVGEIEEYEENNSGRFGPDVGKTYLLFLNPAKPQAWSRNIVRDAWEVNYNCGQSKLWSDVSKVDRDALAKIAAARK